ncbi:hypothetical protein BDC45DRAFT_12170 [Circinella umbellata]|nr:hypothetical protein BDC45DRAFT_12170 [Circinella umbellata]
MCMLLCFSVGIFSVACNFSNLCSIAKKKNLVFICVRSTIVKNLIKVLAFGECSFEKHSSLLQREKVFFGFILCQLNASCCLEPSFLLVEQLLSVCVWSFLPHRRQRFLRIRT